MANKTKYQIKKFGARSKYFGTKIALTPVVAIVDTGTAVLQAGTVIAKTAISALTHIAKAPFSGVVRGNQIHKAKFNGKYVHSLDINTKLANGDLVETVVSAESAE